MAEQNFFSQITAQLKNRAASRLGENFAQSWNESCFPLLTSSSDLGVARNGGRRGAQFAPAALLNSFKLMISPSAQIRFFQQEIAHECLEHQNFEHAQEYSKGQVEKLIASMKSDKLLHLGGGHDHIYPLLAGLDSRFKNMHILNVDAHMDTRMDEWAHSGTPFRQFSNVCKNPFSLWEFGIHPYANPAGNFTPLKNCTLNVTKSDEARELSEKEIQQKALKYFNAGDCAVLSVDADGIDGSVMEGVSAVNPDGISKETLNGLMRALVQSKAKMKVLALYEFNPIYENLSQKGQRYLASLMYQFYFSG